MTARSVDPLSYCDLEWLIPQEFFTARMRSIEYGHSTFGKLIEDIQISVQNSLKKMQKYPPSRKISREIFDDIGKSSRMINILNSKASEKILNLGEKCEWVGVGRPHRDANHCIVPSRYWSFLNIDCAAEVAYGEDLKYTSLRIIRRASIPDDHKFLKDIEEAEIVDTTLDTSAGYPVPTPEPSRTEAPGRPSSMPLIFAEFKRRVIAKKILPSLTQESKYLEKWRVENYPTTPQIVAGTISKNLSKDYFIANPKRK